jgi:hypothetical protein
MFTSMAICFTTKADNQSTGKVRGNLKNTEILSFSTELIHHQSSEGKWIQKGVEEN